MKFNLFGKPKQQEKPENSAASQEEPSAAPEATKQEETSPQPELTPAQQFAVPSKELEQVAETPSKTYLKAMPLKDLADIENVKEEVKNGNIIILKVTPLATKSIDDVKNAVNQLYEFAESLGGDIARLGEERVVICPKNIRIWREKTPTPPVSNESLPTVA